MSRLEPRVRVLAGGLVLAIGLAFALARLSPNSAIGSLPFNASWAMGDFAGVVYYPALDFLKGGNPYNRETYLARFPAPSPFPGYTPSALLFNLPFALLPFHVAASVYVLATIGLTLLLAGAILRWAGWRVTTAAILGVSGVILLSRPGHWNLMLGQVATQLVLATYLAIMAGRDAPTLGGVGLAISLMKPTFGIPLILLVLAQGARAAAARGIALSAAINLPVLAILVHREGGVAPFMETFRQGQSTVLGHGHSSVLFAVWRVDLSACIGRLSDAAIGLVGQAAVALSVLGIAVWAVRRQVANPEGGRLTRGITCSAILLASYHHAYDLLLLALPAADLAMAWRSRKSSRPLLAAQGGILAVLAGNYLSTQSTIMALAPSGGTRLALVSINCVAMVGLFGLYLFEAAKAQGFGAAGVRD